jgi:putative phage-type endonuclease
VALSESALNRRHKYLGASDVAAVLGLSPWKSASDVYYSKVACLDPEVGEPSAAIQAGNLLEGAVLDFAEKHVGKLKRNQFRVHAEQRWASATLDAICVGPDYEDEGVEAKTTSNSSHWGEEGTDQIPIYYLTQVQWQMYITGYKRIHVPVLMPDFTLRFKMYVVDRDEELIESIVQRCTAFWYENVLAKKPPLDTVPAPKILQRMKRVPEKVTTIGDELVSDWRIKKAALKHAATQESESRLRMLEALGDAEVGKFTGGVINYFKRERRERTQTIKKSTYRTLSIKEGEGDEV